VCESTNNILKVRTQWRLNQLPQLIEKLREIVVSQFHEAESALMGRGELTSTLPATTMTSTSNAVMNLPAGHFDTSFGPPSFHGHQHKDAGSWLSRFDKYATYRGFNDMEKRNFTAVLLKDDASDWLDSLDPATVMTWAQLWEVFDKRLKDSDLCRYQKVVSLWQCVQGETESVDS